MSKKINLNRIILYCCFLIISSIVSDAHAGSDESFFVYVSLQKENAVAIYNMDKTTGKLTLIEKQTVTGGPASMTLDPTKQYLYLAQRNVESFTSFRINHQNGKISLMNSIPALSNPVYTATDRTGKYLLSVYYSAGKSAIYSIDTSGLLQTPAKQVLGGYNNPHSIGIDSSNRYIFIPDKSNDKIYQYLFDADSGTMYSNDPPSVFTGSGVGPRHLVFNNANTIVYIVNELSGTVSGYHLNGEIGTLSHIQTIPTFPEGYTGTNACADIRLTPNNKFLFASHRGLNIIAAFSVNENSELTKIETYPTRNTPRSFVIGPDGKYLIAAGENSNDLETYSINQETGELNSLGVTQTGLQPSWIMILDPNPDSTATSAYQMDEQPSEFYISQNYPNPFNPMTEIKYVIPVPGNISIKIYNLNGECVSILKDSYMDAGNYAIVWNSLNHSGDRVSSGLYFCTIQAGVNRKTIRMVLMK